MLEIRIDQAGKRFQYEWIFRNLTTQIKSGEKLAVTGSNGSGKSTLLKCLAGQMPLSEGTISYQTKGQTISPADIYTQIGLSAPYLELPEEYTLTEFLQFHFRFKQLMPSLGVKETIQLMYLEPASNKPISLFSSGMKQRLKLGICLFSSSPLLLLDEPTSNLDARGIAWYLEMINTYGADKTLIICSNDEREFSFCNRRLAIEEYK